MGLKVVIFDLGGVLFESNFSKRVAAFNKLGFTDFAESYNELKQTGLIKRLEVGEISATDFYVEFRKQLNCELSDRQIGEAWCKMIGSFNLERLSFLEKLSKKYRLFACSNTNEILTPAVEEKCLKEAGLPLSSYFEAIFYSHKLGLRKPDVEMFRRVVSLIKENEDEVMFIDDDLSNVEAARKLGLQALQLLPTRPIAELNL
ncbi:MAG: HAD family phosphatase [Streptococcaceae bacterium]|jgi:putative hydrolase of the HAD superfamily|nr:HAD family phosphatase [Streptococcaceae bacterium]